VRFDRPTGRERGPPERRPALVLGEVTSVPSSRPPPPVRFAPRATRPTTPGARAPPSIAHQLMPSAS
jgi:hypothetical protein